MLKPILIGMNNPVSTRPGHELYPLPEGCTGHRIFSMLRSRVPTVTMRQYLETFERRNLVRAVEWDKSKGRARAYETLVELRGKGRTIVLLGSAVRESFDWVLRGEGLLDPSCLPGIPPLLVHPQKAGGLTWRQIPHPSGRNLFYNDEKNREIVALLLEELYLSYNAGLAAQQREMQP